MLTSASSKWISMIRLLAKRGYWLWWSLHIHHQKAIIANSFESTDLKYASLPQLTNATTISFEESML